MFDACFHRLLVANIIEKFTDRTISNLSEERKLDIDENDLAIYNVNTILHN